MGKPRTPAGRAKEVVKRLADVYPGTPQELCELDFENPFQLLTATILSAQTTDVRVNMTTPALFQAFPDAAALAAADPGQVEKLIVSTGFYRNKTKSIIAMAAALIDRHHGEVPSKLEDLVELPGVGRKTANVVRGVAMNLPAIPVDTHVIRLSNRLGLTAQQDPVKIEHELMPLVPKTEWSLMSERLILHGRRVCIARKPQCDECALNDFCPSSLLPTRKSPRRKAAELEAVTE